MPFVDVDQLSTDWLRMKVACVSASHTCDVMAKLQRVKKAKEGETPIPPQEAAPRRKYRKAKVREELTGMSMESYVTPYMEKGLDVEPLAREAYQFRNDVEVENGGIYFHDTIPRYCASPDGRIGEDGLLEIKYLTGITTEANHLDLMVGDAEIPEDYRLQMDSQLACSGRKWVDFVSFDPEMPKDLRLFVKRYPRDEQRIQIVEAEVCQFLEEMVAALKKLGQKINIEVPA